jgi:hypothetical protein
MFRNMKGLVGLIVFLYLTGYTADFSVKTTLQDTNTCDLIEAAINFDELQPFYHIDRFTNRIPLTINLGNHVVSCPSLEKFGEPVIILDDESVSRMEHDAEMTIDLKEVTPNRADLTLWYPAEGVYAHMRFEIIESRWVVTDSRLFER